MWNSSKRNNFPQNRQISLKILVLFAETLDIFEPHETASRFQGLVHLLHKDPAASRGVHEPPCSTKAW